MELSLQLFLLKPFNTKVYKIFLTALFSPDFIKKHRFFTVFYAFIRYQHHITPLYFQGFQASQCKLPNNFTATFFLLFLHLETQRHFSC